MNSSIVKSIFNNSLKNPNKICLIDSKNDKTYSYSDYFRNIYGFSLHLKNLGLQKNETVVIQASQSIEFLTAIMAINLAGGIFIPVEKKIGLNRLLEIVNKVNSKLVILNTDFEINKKIIINIKDVNNYFWNEDLPEKIIFPEKNDVTEILFTTGTTGVSKGVVMSGKASFSVAENVKYGLEMKENNIDLISVPINHSYGLRRFYGNMINGSCVVLIDGVIFVEKFFTAIEKYKVTSLTLVPGLVSVILKLSKDRISNYKNQIDYVQIGTTSFSQDNKEKLIKLLPNSRLYNFYGSTEAGCSSIIDYNKPNINPLCIGKATFNSEIVFLDDENNITNATFNNPGRLATKGSMIMNCYFDAPKLTEQVFVKGYIASNDLAFSDEDGNIYLIGRQDDVINVGGNKIAPTEIEEIANRVVGVLESACIPIKDKIAGEVPKLFVVMKPNFEFLPNEIQSFLAKHLENFKLPKVIEEINEIPKTFNGKINRSILKKTS